MGISPFVRNMLGIVGASTAALLFLNYREETASVWTATGYVRSVTTTDTDSYETPNYETPTAPPKPALPWPELNDLLSSDKRSIKADVQSILDFAIIGHPKCATTFSMHWLSHHEGIQMHGEELHYMQTGDPAGLINKLYELEPGYQYKRGYKAPRDITNVKALTAFAKYFPETKLIIGVRHPVLWFQSFYNFRVRGGTPMPPAETLMGELQKGMNGVSTGEAKFHVNLDNLGKTERSPEEQLLLGGGRHEDLPRAKNPVFLYELNQLHDSNATRAAQYITDLQNYLGIPPGLETIADGKKEKHEAPPGTINICDMKYRFVRAELMKNAVEASKWIREYFLASPDVTVSSPEYFRALVESWMTDPCEYD